jgi:hypothetical protein
VRIDDPIVTNVSSGDWLRPRQVGSKMDAPDLGLQALVDRGRRGQAIEAQSCMVQTVINECAHRGRQALSQGFRDGFVNR